MDEDPPAEINAIDEIKPWPYQHIVTYPHDPRYIPASVFTFAYADSEPVECPVPEVNLQYLGYCNKHWGRRDTHKEFKAKPALALATRIAKASCPVGSGTALQDLLIGALCDRLGLGDMAGCALQSSQRSAAALLQMMPKAVCPQLALHLRSCLPRQAALPSQ